MFASLSKSPLLIASRLIALGIILAPSAWLCTSGWPAGDEHEAVEQVGWDFLHLSAARRGSESRRCPQLAPDQGEGVAERGIVFRVPADAGLWITHEHPADRHLHAGVVPERGAGGDVEPALAPT